MNFTLDSFTVNVTDLSTTQATSVQFQDEESGYSTEDSADEVLRYSPTDYSEKNSSNKSSLCAAFEFDTSPQIPVKNTERHLKLNIESYEKHEILHPRSILATARSMSWNSKQPPPCGEILVVDKMRKSQIYNGGLNSAQKPSELSSFAWKGEHNRTYMNTGHKAGTKVGENVRQFEICQRKKRATVGGPGHADMLEGKYWPRVSQSPPMNPIRKKRPTIGGPGYDALFSQSYSIPNIW